MATEKSTGPCVKAPLQSKGLLCLLFPCRLFSHIHGEVLLFLVLLLSLSVMHCQILEQFIVVTLSEASNLVWVRAVAYPS